MAIIGGGGGRGGQGTCRVRFQLVYMGCYLIFGFIVYFSAGLFIYLVYIFCLVFDFSDPRRAQGNEERVIYNDQE